MKIHAVLALLVVGAGAVNLRTESRLWSDVERSLFNNTISDKAWSHSVGLMQREVEMVRASPPTVDKMLYTLLAIFFGACGCDRCYMGQIALGVLKVVTGGCCYIWTVIDLFIALYHALTYAPEIHMLGFHAIFHPSSLAGAYYVACAYVGWVFFVWCCQCCMACCTASAMSNDGLDEPSYANSMKGALPMTISTGLRRASLISDRPSDVEIYKMFDRMDQNGDGKLDHKELKAGLSEAGVSEAEIDEMIKCADTDKDGKLDKKEFIRAVKDMP